MSDAWPLRLTVDARGHDDSSVRVRRTSPSTAAYLSVRVGPVLVYCLDSAAVTGIASAWARAYAAAADLLPTDSRHPRPLATRGGYAAPTAQVVAEGRQRWDVTPPRPGHPYAEVSSSWLTVRVHDATALRAHTRAWAQAVDLGQTAFRPPPMPFARGCSRRRPRRRPPTATAPTAGRRPDADRRPQSARPRRAVAGSGRC